MNDILLKITELDSLEQKNLDRCISLQFEKEYYTSYSLLRGTFVLEGNVGEIIDAELYIDGKLIHKGLLDTAEIRQHPHYKTLSLVSRGYSSLLAQNEITPGFHQGISVNTLMDNTITLPHITHENLSDTVNYIYVKDHSSMWEAISNLCLKGYGALPYIAHVNKVRFTFPSGSKLLTFSDGDGKTAALGKAYDYTKILSDYHMMDASGTYNTFNRSLVEASQRNLVRHKHVGFDDQWLDDPHRGLGYELDYSLRGYRGSFVEYAGHQGEDLGDRFIVNGQPALRISKIEIRTRNKAIFTRLTAYSDRYNNTNVNFTP